MKPHKISGLALIFYGASCGGFSFLVWKILMATSENPELCITLPRQNAHLPNVETRHALSLPASLDFGAFGACLYFRIYKLCQLTASEAVAISLAVSSAIIS